MRHHRTLIALACVALLTTAHAQTTPCPGEPLIFQVEGENHGTKTWEHSTDGVTWNTVEVVENQPFILQPEQSGWYRVRFHDEECNISYVSEAQRYVAHAIELGDALTLTIVGVVRDEFGGRVGGATVRAGCGAGVSTTTDHFGVFLLQGIAAYEGLAQVTVEKEGYFTGSRSFVPGANAEETISHAYITLLKKNLAGTVQSASGGQVVLEGVTINFPANGFQQNGQPYTGPVSVYLNHIDPTSADLHAQMPGILMGMMNDEPQLMLSYGMVGVELSDASGQALQLASGSTATVRFPIVALQQNTAPATIPLWWFDEDLGYWTHEGEAQRVGNQYVGQVAHFSWWNCDVPGNFVELDGVASDSYNGAGLAGARIVVITQAMGTRVTYADGKGEFSGLVPAGQQLTIEVQLPCGPNGSWVMVHTETVGPYTQPSAIVLNVTIPDQKFLTGTVVDCDGLPVDGGYVFVNGAVYFCMEGVFAVFSCTSSITIRAVDASTTHVSTYSTIELVNDTTNVGELITCTPVFGTMTDIDGNIYQTVIIGNQDWMAENLRTTRNRDGSTIPNVTDDTAWTQQNSGAWCNYQNISSNDATYGKLYNWYAAANTNICPQGWHVPTDAEWRQLEVALGMPTGELGQTGFRGDAQNVGGRMKTTSLWNSPNTGATNESGFSGLPGGYRISDNGYFDSLGSNGYRWTASESGAEGAWNRRLGNGNAGISRGYSSKRMGFCLRCVRD
jgi:uncharacterized protein (TIGR02145 family)